MHTTTLRIVSAALFSLAAAGAQAAGDDPAYPMGAGAGMRSHAPPAAAAFVSSLVSSHVWLDNEVGLVHRNVGESTSQHTPFVPMAESAPSAVPARGQATIFLGA